MGNKKSRRENRRCYWFIVDVELHSTLFFGCRKRIMHLFSVHSKGISNSIVSPSEATSRFSFHLLFFSLLSFLWQKHYYHQILIDGEEEMDMFFFFFFQFFSVLWKPRGMNSRQHLILFVVEEIKRDTREEGQMDINSLRTRRHLNKKSMRVREYSLILL